MKPIIKDFIERHIDKIQDNEFKTIYKYTLEIGMTPSEISQLTEIFIDSGINPLFHTSWYIPKNFLYGCENVSIMDEKLIIPDNIVEIDSYAFYDSIIREFKCPTRLETLYTHCFADCRYLNKITFNEKLREIGVACFAETKIKELIFPDSLEFIMTSAFEGCEQLEKVSLPKNIKKIGFGAFEYCTKLKEIEIRCSEEEWDSLKNNRIIASNAFPKDAKFIYIG